MLSKFLLTLAVITIAVVILQRRRLAARAADTSSSGGQATAPAKPPASDFRIGAWMFLVLMLGAASVIGVQRWQDANREVTVLLHREGDANPVIYRVNKNQLAERAFTTTDGVRVTVSANERMEVVGL